jgi:hypothetical protein
MKSGKVGCIKVDFEEVSLIDIKIVVGAEIRMRLNKCHPFHAKKLLETWLDGEIYGEEEITIHIQPYKVKVQ